jgi:excisionase family DNA binding protein
VSSNHSAILARILAVFVNPPKKRWRDWNTEWCSMPGRNKKVVEVSTCPLPPRGLRIADAAKYMGVSPWFVEEEIRAGRLPALKLCRHYTLLKEDLDEYLDYAKKKVA